MTAPLPTLRHRTGPNKVSLPMIARMRALADAGLSCNAIAAVILLDQGISLHEQTVRRYVGPRMSTARLSKDNSANWGEAVGGRP